MGTVINPCQLTVVDATGFRPAHVVTDLPKLAALAEDMTARGWHGPPLLVMSEYAKALTGTHRLAAAEQTDLSPVPGVEVEELLAANDLDLWEYRSVCDSLDAALEELLRRLPRDVYSAYGIDLF